jgi:hypothetical protein
LNRIATLGNLQLHTGAVEEGCATLKRAAKAAEDLVRLSVTDLAQRAWHNAQNCKTDLEKISMGTSFLRAMTKALYPVAFAKRPWR